MKRMLPILLLLFGSYGITHADDLQICADDPDCDPLRFQVTTNDYTFDRIAWVFPGSQAHVSPAPVVIYFHGSSGTAKWSAFGRQFHHVWPEAIVVYTEGVKDFPAGEDAYKTGWQNVPERLGQYDDWGRPILHPNRDLDYVDQLIEILNEEYMVDTRRIYATGYSNGCKFVFVLMHERAEKFAAFAPSSCFKRFGLKIDNYGSPYQASKPQPIHYMFGDMDDVFLPGLEGMENKDELIAEYCADVPEDEVCAVFDQITMEWIMENNMTVLQPQNWKDTEYEYYMPDDSSGADALWNNYPGWHSWWVEEYETEYGIFQGDKERDIVTFFQDYAQDIDYTPKPTCIIHTEINTDHIANDRAYACGFFNLSACALGSDDDLGWRGTTTSIIESPYGYYAKGSQCPESIDYDPVLTLRYGADMTIGLGSVFEDPGLTADDYEDGNLNDAYVISGDTVNTDVVGNYVIAYSVTDSGGNTAQAIRTVNVVALGDQPPVIHLEGDAYMAVVVNTAFEDPGAYATDYEDDDQQITENIQTTGTVDINMIGDYFLYYNVTDSYGNEALEKVRSVSVVEDAPPVITIIGGNPMSIQKGTPFVDPGVTVTDDADDNIEAVVTGSVDIHTPGRYLLTYTATDSAGNQADPKSREVIVVDTTRCVTDTNYHHVEEERAHIESVWFSDYAHANGSNDNLGLVGSLWWSTTTSIEETSPGYWMKVENCN